MNATLDLALSDRQRAALGVLRLGRGTRANDIVRIADVGPRTLSTLAALGLVERRDAGGRGALYHLTAAGRRAALEPIDAFNEAPVNPDPGAIDHKENTAMSTATADPKVKPRGKKNSRPAAPAKPAAKPNGNAISGRDATIAAFRAAGKPLTPNEAAAIVIASGVPVAAKGKTPMDYRLFAPIYREAKNGRYYQQVGDDRPAKFELRDDAPASDPKLVEAICKSVAAAK